MSKSHEGTTMARVHLTDTVYCPTCNHEEEIGGIVGAFSRAICRGTSITVFTTSVVARIDFGAGYAEETGLALFDEFLSGAEWAK